VKRAKTVGPQVRIDTADVIAIVVVVVLRAKTVGPQVRIDAADVMTKMTAEIDDDGQSGQTRTTEFDLEKEPVVVEDVLPVARTPAVDLTVIVAVVVQTVLVMAKQHQQQEQVVMTVPLLLLRVARSKARQAD